MVCGMDGSLFVVLEMVERAGSLFGMWYGECCLGSGGTAAIFIIGYLGFR